MKKIITIFLVISTIAMAKANFSVFLGQGLNTVNYSDGSTDELFSTYGFGTEIAIESGENFEFGVGVESISLKKIGTVDLSTDKLFPAYFRIEAKGSPNEIFVPYIFGTYGKLVVDLEYVKADGTTVKASHGISKSIGIGAVIQNNTKVEIYDGTLTSEFQFVNGLVKSKDDVEIKIVGVRLAYIFN